jgi:hypothetical protein
MGELRAGADRWIQQRWQRGENISDRAIRDQLRPEYLLAHSLAHALITEVGIDCGYPASSIPERIYISQNVGDPGPDVGILIYTVSAGNQGTLGWPVEVSRRFAQVLDSALERQLPLLRRPRSVPIMTRRPRPAIGAFTVPPVMAALSSPKQAAKPATCSSIGRFWSIRWDRLV